MFTLLNVTLCLSLYFFSLFIIKIIKKIILVLAVPRVSLFLYERREGVLTVFCHMQKVIETLVLFQVCVVIVY